MDNEKVYVTRGELLDAIEKNGLPQVTGGLFAEREDTLFPTNAVPHIIGAACALGQGYINLGIYHLYPDYDDNEDFYDRDNIRGDYNDFTSAIISRNDDEKMPVKQIAREVREIYKDSLHVRMVATTWEYNVAESAWIDNVEV